MWNNILYSLSIGILGILGYSIIFYTVYTIYTKSRKILQFVANLSNQPEMDSLIQEIKIHDELTDGGSSCNIWLYPTYLIVQQTGGTETVTVNYKSILKEHNDKVDSEETKQKLKDMEDEILRVEDAIKITNSPDVTLNDKLKDLKNKYTSYLGTLKKDRCIAYIMRDRVSKRPYGFVSVNGTNKKLYIYAIKKAFVAVSYTNGWSIRVPSSDPKETVKKEEISISIEV